MTTITSTTSSTNGGTSVLSGKGATFGDNPFLRLLTEQLKNQTPLEPVDNDAFMNQMASYSSMQEQKDLNKNMLQLLDYQGLLARMQGLSQGSALLGKEVTYAGDGGRDQKGIVESVYVAEDGNVHLKLNDGKDVTLAAVKAIGEADDDTGTGTGTGTTANSNATTGSTVA